MTTGLDLGSQLSRPPRLQYFGTYQNICHVQNAAKDEVRPAPAPVPVRSSFALESWKSDREVADIYLSSFLPSLKSQVRQSGLAGKTFLHRHRLLEQPRLDFLPCFNEQRVRNAL